MTLSDTESTSLQAAWHSLAAARQESSKSIANGQLLLSTSSTGQEWAITFCSTRCNDIEKVAVRMLYLKVSESNSGSQKASVTLTFDRAKGDDCLPLWPAMVEEVAKAVLSASEPARRGKVLEKTLKQWANWWPHGEKLDPKRVMGLVGELAFLEHLAVKLGPQEAVSAWNGPDADNQDFCIGRTAFEVKCQNKNLVVEIASLKQLDDGPFASLYLVAFRCIDTNNHQMSLQERCDSIIRHIGSNEALAARFMRALGKAGWFRATNKQREEQHAVRFTAYHVKAGFPRLLKGPAYLPPGVILKSYKVDLGQCGKFKMEEPEFNAVVEALANPQGSANSDADV